jgi:hypothetical protein
MAIAAQKRASEFTWNGLAEKSAAIRALTTNDLERSRRKNHPEHPLAHLATSGCY